MRQIVLDTETTGLEPAEGHRIIEIGCVELLNRRQTRNTFHHYLQPDREIDHGALEVHGIDQDFLADKPHFSEVVDEFLAFIQGAELIIHNAPFDVGFLDHELALLNASKGTIDQYAAILDTLQLARRMHPGQRNSLDALCKRYDIDNSQRQYHGALLDAEILADVYLVMTGGQAKLSLDGTVTEERVVKQEVPKLDRSDLSLKVIHADAEELAAHEARLDAIQDRHGLCVWRDAEGAQE
ncbi:MAG: DNA polymerase III subunit epsilon [Gammaproteobacteria bacterium]|nr:DNA polymerase III subunit epsilon [Gammaproteobacteria bacterium]